MVFRFRAGPFPLLAAALEYARQKQIPGGAGRNKLYLEGKIEFARPLDDDLYEIFFDPQTSGGLLIAIPPAKLDSLTRELDASDTAHWVVGEVTDDKQMAEKQSRISVI